jgi:uncharacterized iron-regulated membrane protein
MSTMEAASPAASPISLRRWLLRIHLWIGITLCIPFALLGITGSILVYDQDFLAPPPKATAAGTIQPLGAILAAGAATHPGFKVTQVVMPRNAGDPAVLRLSDAGGPRRGFGELAYIDPVSLMPLGTRGTARTPFLDLVHSLHGSLALGGRTGRPIVGWLGIGMTILGLTGLVLWWPRKGGWRNAFWVSKGARGYAFHRQLHASAGILGWIAFVTVSFTGVAISFPQSIGPALQAVFGGSPAERVGAVDAPAGAALANPERVVEVALRAAPNARLAALSLPANEKQPYRVTLIGESAIAGAPAINVFVNPFSAEVMSVRDPRNYALGDSIMAWQRTIHDGRAFGPAWTFLVFLSGLLPPLFAVTGTTMWWLKRRSRLVLRRRAALAKVPAE